MKRILAFTLTFLGMVGILKAELFDISLRWTPNPPVQMVTKYVVYQAVGSTTNAFIPVVTSTGTNAVKVRVTAAGLYFYKVAAFNGVTNSPLSEAVQVPKDAPSTPPQPEVISVEVK